VQRNLVLSAAAVVVGLILIGIGVVYFAEPASSLPSFFPGHTAGSSHHHVKHGLAAVLLGIACLAYAWFSSAPKRA
jgi:uncharacterized membrane protein HdeD (DUF308 family)